ncbi:MAG: hypothetical protein WBM90_05945, partial [Acidimicrobiia bacterium]
MVDFAVHAGPLKELGVRVAAASVDPIDSVRRLKEGLRAKPGGASREDGIVRVEEVVDSFEGRFPVGPM